MVGSNFHDKRGVSYQSTDDLTKVTSVHLFLVACGNMLAIFSAWKKYESVQSSQEDLLMNFFNRNILFPHDSLSIGLWMIELAAFVLFLFWLYRAHSNLKIIQNQPTVFQSSWAFISFIVPIINLFAPYQLTGEVWQKSLPSQNIATKNILIPAWWGMCLCMASSGVAFWWFMDYSKRHIVSTTSLDIICHVASVGAAVLTIVLINKINTFQSEQIRAINERQS